MNVTSYFVVTSLISSLLLLMILGLEVVPFKRDPNHGTLFSPYTKFGDVESLKYSMDEIEVTLGLVSHRFQKITAWGYRAERCVEEESCHVNSTESLVAHTAAKLNKKLGYHAIQIDIAADWSNVYSNELWWTEVQYAFGLAAAVNAEYSGTVTGIILPTYYEHDLLGDVIQFIKDYKKRPNTLPLNLGIRYGDCNALSSVEPDNFPKIAIDFATSLDFIICNVWPELNRKNETMSWAGNIFGEKLLKIRGNFRKVNPSIEIRAETGLPSEGVSRDGIIGSIETLRTFWGKIVNWSKVNDFRVDVYSAFDEPWRSMVWNEVEGHYGWWARVSNESNGPDAFVEKLMQNSDENPEPILEDRMIVLPILNNTNELESTTNFYLYGFTNLKNQTQDLKRHNKSEDQNHTNVIHKPEERPGYELDSYQQGGLGLFGFVIVVLMISIATLCIRLKDIQSKQLTNADVDEFVKGKPAGVGSDTDAALRLPYDRKYEIQKHMLTFDKTEVLGSGAFGMVFRGKLKNHENDIALKIPRQQCSSQNLKSLLLEIKVMIHVGHHYNVVSIIGAYTGEIQNGVVMIAIELCEEGSLEARLRKNKDYFSMFSTTSNDSLLVENQLTSTNNCPPIHFEDLVKYSYHIACGMEHIASKKVIHSDLAVRNVLLTKDGTAKITDFGLSRNLYEYSNYVKKTEVRLPWRSMAIESLKHMEFSTKSDVWSYGITLWEIFSLGEIPWGGFQWTPEFNTQIENGLRLCSPQHASEEIYKVMIECWNKDPKRRPSFLKLKDFFEMLIRNMSTGYLNLRTTYSALNVEEEQTQV